MTQGVFLKEGVLESLGLSLRLGLSVGGERLRVKPAGFRVRV